MVDARGSARKVAVMAGALKQIIQEATPQDFEGLKHGLLQMIGELERQSEDLMGIIEFNRKHGTALRVVSAL